MKTRWTTLFKKVTHKDFKGGIFKYYSKLIYCIVKPNDIYISIDKCQILHILCDCKQIDFTAVLSNNEKSHIIEVLNDLYNDKFVEM